MLTIYLIGVFITLTVCTRTVLSVNTELCVGDLFIVILISLFSYPGLLLYVFFKYPEKIAKFMEITLWEKK